MWWFVYGALFGWMLGSKRRLEPPDPAWRPTDVAVRRIFAFMIDVLAAATLAAIVVSPFANFAQPADLEPGEAIVGWVAWLLWIGFVGAVVFLHGWMQGRTGRTPGKILFGIRTIGPTGLPPGQSRAMVRTLLLPVDIFYWPLIHHPRRPKTRQRLGDRAANTWVVRNQAPWRDLAASSGASGIPDAFPPLDPPGGAGARG